MVLSPEKTYRRKVQEMLLARDMEAQLSKPEILELYINRINLGPQVFGIEAASQKYFGHSARTLSLSEAALLAALPKAPSRYDPTRNFESALSRSHLVLQRMTANGFISPEQELEARKSPPVMVEDAEPLLDPDVIGYVFDLVTDRANELIGEKRQDLIIRTTLDTQRQKQADAAIKKVLETSGKAKNISEGSLISIENETGAVRALVGGRDYATSKFNRASQAKRQPGSAFKSIVYAAAMEEGFTPGTIRIDQPIEIKGWAPENYTRRYRGPITLREALKLSINTVAAQVGSEIGPTKVVSTAKRFGIKSEMRPEYSIALGTSEVNLLELTTSYSVFANEGLLKPSYFITEITDTAKRTLYTRREAQSTRAYAVPYSRQMTGMLRDVIDSGTGYGAKLGNRPAAGKTGTSQDYRDAWFVGFTAQYTTGIWMGNDDNSPTQKVTGGLLPVDAWKAFMLDAHKGLKVRPLPAPDPTPDDPRVQRQVAFYESLSQALERERNMANGVLPSSAQFSTAGR
jgi:penicillin-binding protein 1A